jgi:hypothetical protein
MTLRGIKPTAVEKRLKAMFYGPAGVGKTMTAIQFPRPYLIDTEKGAENEQYVRALEKAGGVYFHTTDPEDLMREITALLSEKHSYQTVIIDPLTVIYDRLIERGIEEKGEEFGRYKTVSDRAIKHLLALLTRLDMNVIVTSHAKARWVRAKDAQGRDTATQDGLTFDCYPKLDYLFDLAFEVTRRGQELIGVVRKTRVENFPLGEIFPFNYQEIAKRYGREVLERDSIPVVLTTREQLATLKALLDPRKDSADILEKMRAKVNAETDDELPADLVDKAIAYYKPAVVVSEEKPKGNSKPKKTEEVVGDSVQA